jgi:hypothetical protein
VQQRGGVDPFFLKKKNKKEGRKRNERAKRKREI